MADSENEKPFAIEKAKTGRAKCKKCKCPIDKDSVRIAKLVNNPFGDGFMKAWHHVTCIFDVFAKQRASTKRIVDPLEDVSGWNDLLHEDQKIVLEKIQELEDKLPSQNQSARVPKKVQSPETSGPPAKKIKVNVNDSVASTSKKVSSVVSKINENKETNTPDKKNTTLISTKDNSFREFRRICAELANESAYTEKTAIIKRMLTKGSDGDGFKSDVVLWCKLLLPNAVKRIYNLQSKQLIKLFARLFHHSEDEMLEDLEQGDVAETIRLFFEKSKVVKSSSKSLLTLQEVDTFLEELAQLTKEEEQNAHFLSIIEKCTSNDLKMIIRLIKRDLRINAGPKHILEAVHSDAYRAYQVSNDLTAVIRRCLDGVDSSGSSTSHSDTSKLTDVSKVSLSLMTPVLPMLAEACKSVEMAMKKCPNGMLSEVKYDGERVQVHKKGAEFRYYSRSLKPVLAHKVKHFKDFIPKAFPDGDDLILDSEILMIDTTTGQPLPFGTLGKHKKDEFKDANVCLFVFDCIYYNGEVLMNKPIKIRRKILEERMTTIPNRIMLSEVEKVRDPKDLAKMIAKVLRMGLEGLVLKDMNSLYEPGKRHWLKVKKDYLFDGAMADSADLVVLGAWYGTGQKGGMKSVFLMGCYDEDNDKWVTVTKVHTGHDDATLARLQDELDMIKIAKDHNQVPKWLTVNRPMVPDFVARDPKKQPIWEITGAEFTNQGVHTADSISIRFPRVTKIRDDKCWKTATSLKELKALFEKSSTSMDFSLLLGTKDENDKKKASTLDDYVKPGVSGIGKSPAVSAKKKKKENSSNDDEENEKDEKEEKKKIVKNINKASNTERKVKKTEKWDNDHSSSMDFSLLLGTKDENDKIKTSTLDDYVKPGVSGIGKSPAVSPKKRKKENLFNDDEENEEDEKEEKKIVKNINKASNTERKVKQTEKWNDGQSYESKTNDVYSDNTLSIEDETKAVDGVFAGVRACLSHEIAKNKRQNVIKTLKTPLGTIQQFSLGAKVLKDHESFQATHVIHDVSEVPETILLDYMDVPKTARHVNYSWVEGSASESQMLDALPHVVKLVGSYCNCPCPHRRRGAQ